MTSLVERVDDNLFVEAVRTCKNYTEIAAYLGADNPTAATEVKRRISKMNLKFCFKPATWQSDEEFFTINHYHNSGNLRRRFLAIESIPYRCVICGQKPSWNGKELTLEIDHVNGDSTDCRLENLRWLCPNCHSQTETYKAKNKRNSCRKFSYGILACSNCGKSFNAKHRHAKYCSRSCSAAAKERKPPVDKTTLYNLLKENSFTSVARMYGVSDNAVRKWCRKYGLSYHASSYK